MASLGLVLAITGLVKGKSLGRQNKMWAVMGIVANALALCAIIAFMVFFPTIMNNVDKEIKPPEDEVNQPLE